MRRLVLPLLVVLALPAQAAQPAESEIERLRGELLRAGAAEQAGEGTAIAQRRRLVELNAEEAEIRARMEQNRGALAKLLGALQLYQRRPPPPLLVNPRSAKDAVRAAILIRAITPDLEARGRAFSAQVEAIGRVRRVAATASESLFRAESDVAERRAEIEKLSTAKLGLEAQLHPDTGEASATRALAARAGSVEALVERLARPAGAGVPARAPERLSAPVQGVVIRRFGQPVPGRGRSEGWTWRAQPMAAVLAPAAGRVDYAGPLKGWGDVVILNAGGDRRLVLAGLEEVGVSIGAAVAVGEPVGRLGAGDPEARTPPEFYLEVRGAGGALDPARWFNVAAHNSANVRR